MLSLTAIFGSLASIAFLFVPSSSPAWPISSFLAVVGNVSFGLSLVALNAYLPIIAKAIAQSTDTTEVARATARLSARGIATGYAAGCIMLGLALVPLLLTQGSTWGMRIAIGASGAWWLAFGMVAVLLIPATFGARLTGSSSPRFRPLDGWRGLGAMLRSARKLPQTFVFLLAWLLLSDAFTTVNAVAILFAKTTLFMSTPELILLGILAPLCGIAGALLWPRVAHRYGLSNLHTLVLLVCLATLIPLYGCLGFLPLFKRVGFGGLTTSSEMYALAVFFGANLCPSLFPFRLSSCVHTGVVYGGFQSYARVVYAAIIPAGQEARFFSLYSITDKCAFFSSQTSSVILKSCEQVCIIHWSTHRWCDH